MFPVFVILSTCYPGASTSPSAAPAYLPNLHTLVIFVNISRLLQKQTDHDRGTT